MNGQASLPNRTEFDGQPLELDLGADYTVNKDGAIERIPTNRNALPVTVIAHPLTIARRMVNIDTGETKLELAYRRKGRKWRRIIVNRGTINTNANVVKLADSDIDVPQSRAGEVVRYLSALENLNLDRIPEVRSCGRMGYADGDSCFLPYADDIAFDGDAAFAPMFRSIRAEGSFEEWQHAALELCMTLPGRLALDASFASALVKPLKCLPFFVHLWGTKSGTGKTLALMGAASVWADPAPGRYIQTFNSTAVGHERIAEFLQNLPLIIDELQISKDWRGQVVYDPYKLAEGIGRTRGTRTGGVERTPTWHNCILTSGETPLIRDTAAAGAKNRAIEVEVDQPLTGDGHALAAKLGHNFGHAGRMFVEWVMQNHDLVEQAYGMYYRDLTAFTSKQALSGALLLTADNIVTTLGIVPKLRCLKAADLMPYLKTDEDIEINRALYAQMCDWVVGNMNGFLRDDRHDDHPPREIFGKYDWKKNIAYILPSRFDAVVESFGGVSRSFKKWLLEKGLIIVRPGTRGTHFVTRVIDRAVSTVAIRLPDREAEAVFDDADEKGLLNIDV